MKSSIKDFFQVLKICPAELNSKLMGEVSSLIHLMIKTQHLKGSKCLYLEKDVYFMVIKCSDAEVW